MADNTNRTPVPRPRVSRTGIQRPSSNQPTSQQPPPSSQTQIFTPRPDGPAHGGGGTVRYIRPVTPQSTSLGGYNTLSTPGHALSPPYSQQMSTPLPSSTYQHPVTPANYRSNLKEYSGPQKVMSPAPFPRTNDNGDPRGHIPSTTPRKDSWNSSRSSVSSSEPPSPLRLISEDLSVEIESKKELKLSLQQEIDSLSQEKRTLFEEVEKEKLELEEMRRELGKCNEQVNKLITEENSIRRRLAQSEQNLQLMTRLAATPPAPIDLQQREQNVKRRERELEENELSLEERSSKIRQTEIELQSQADVLFQRKKELELREYDMRNFQGPNQPSVGRGGNSHPDMLEHEERERKIQLKEDELFQRETHITDMEIQLKQEKDRLAKWEQMVQQEDNRAQQNSTTAKELIQQANKLKQEALDASKIAAMLDDDRNETNPKPISDPPGGGGHKTTPIQVSSEASSNGNFGVDNYMGGATGGGYNPSDTSTNATDCSDDMMMARFMNMEWNKALAEEDARIAKQMSTQVVKNETEDADFQFAFQTQLELMGIAPGSVGAEDLKKQLQEAMDKEKKQSEATLRDGEIAASLTHNPS